MELYCEIYDRLHVLEMCALQLVAILMYAAGFEQPVTEGWQLFCLINQRTKLCSAIWYVEV